MRMRASARRSPEESFRGDIKACKSLACGASGFKVTSLTGCLRVPCSFVGRLAGAILNSVANGRADQKASLSLSGFDQPVSGLIGMGRR